MRQTGRRSGPVRPAAWLCVAIARRFQAQNVTCRVGAVSEQKIGYAGGGCTRTGKAHSPANRLGISQGGERIEGMGSDDLFCLAARIAPFVVPALIGIVLLARHSHNALSLMAGLLTLKPLLTTPVYFFLLIIVGSRLISFSFLLPAIVAILPGASLTLIMAVAFRSLLSGPRAGRAWLLLGLDCVRWLNSFLLGLYVAGIAAGKLSADKLSMLSDLDTLVGVSCVLGLAMPTVFAVIAFLIIDTSRGRRRVYCSNRCRQAAFRERRRKRNRPERREGDDGT